MVKRYNPTSFERVDIITTAVMVTNDRAPFDRQVVDALKSSMSEIGLINPITVQREYRAIRTYLVAGRNRLQAAIELGWPEIPAILLPPLDGDAPDASTIGKLAEIAENLHRRQIDDIEKSELVAAWAALRKERKAGLSQVAPNPKGGRPARTGVNAAARELGMSRDAVSRSFRIASLAPEAKAAARKAGVAGNQTVLLEAAKAETPEAQVSAIRSRAADRDVAAAKVVHVATTCKQSSLSTEVQAQDANEEKDATLEVIMAAAASSASQDDIFKGISALWLRAETSTRVRFKDLITS